MILRSLLFVPADSERKLAKGNEVRADALVLDLEDSVDASRKALARALAADYLAVHPAPRERPLWVRINPLDTPEALPDLCSVMRGRPDGIIQPKIRCSADVVRLGHYLDAAEAAHALAPCSTRIVPVATETPQALFSMGTFRECGARLAGLTWGAEDLSAAVGAVTNKNAAGEWTAPYELARSLCLLAASAASVPAIDTLYADFRDLEGLRRACVAARCDGFTGKIAIHPAQVEIINECFTPGPDELSRARRIIAAFAASPDSGTIALDGQMLDIPHLKQARSVLARIGAAKE